MSYRGLLAATRALPWTVTSKFGVGIIVWVGADISTLPRSERSHTQQIGDGPTFKAMAQAVTHAHEALLAGYTTFRDLGSESLGNATTHLRDCINSGLMRGPRLFVSAANPADNAQTHPMSAVRHCLDERADVIRFHADSHGGPYRTLRFLPRPRFPVHPRRAPPLVYNPQEMVWIVDVASGADLHVVAYALDASAALDAVNSGVTTIKNVCMDTFERFGELVEMMKSKGTVWIPGIAHAEAMKEEAPEIFD